MPALATRCGTADCAGEPLPLARPPDEPDLWIRVHRTGTWWSSTIPPIGPQERPGDAGFVCPECRRSLRTIEGGPIGFDRVPA
jgi:hypothetical protein